MIEMKNNEVKVGQVLEEDSQRSVGQVLEQREDGLPPEQDERGLLQLKDAVVDQLDDIPKGSRRVNACKTTYFLPVG